MNHDKEFEDFFKDKFENFEEAPPEMAWNNISSQVSKRPLFSWKRLGIAALLLLSSFITIYFINNSSIKTGNSIDKTATKLEKSSSIATDYVSSENTATTEQVAKGKLHSKGKLQTLNSNALRGSSEAKIDDSKQNSQVVSKVDKTIRNQEIASLKEKNQINQEVEPFALNTNRRKSNRAKTVNDEVSEGIDAKKENVIENQREFDFKKLIPLSYSTPERLAINDNMEENIFNRNTSADSKILNSSTVEKEEKGDSHRKSINPTKNKTYSSKSNTVENDNEDAFSLNSVPPAVKKIKTKKEDKDKDKKDLSKYSYQIFFSPRYTFRRITGNNNDEVFVQSISSSNSKKRMGYEAGIIGSKSVNKNIELNLGLSFVSLNEQITYNYTTGEATSYKIIEKSANQIEVFPIYKVDTVSFKSNYYYSGLTISSSLTYWNKDRKRLYFTVGTGINLLVKGKTEMVVNKTTQSTIYFPSSKSPLQQMNFKLCFAPGYAYKISEKMEFIFEPTINYYITSTFKKREPLGIKPYTLGVNFGLKF